ncbi:MAG: hypothetical protein GY754_29670 [bacterium]|nr:hypothetical protein [bacterium]
MYKEKLENYMKLHVERRHPFKIVLNNEEKKAKKELMVILTDEKNHPFERFYSAIALAYLDDKSGLEILNGVCTRKGKLMIITNSEMEVSEAGLAILVLGEKLPEGFKFSKIINPLFPELDEMKK